MGLELMSGVGQENSGARIKISAVTGNKSVFD